MNNDIQKLIDRYGAVEFSANRVTVMQPDEEDLDVMLEVYCSVADTPEKCLRLAMQDLFGGEE